MLRNLVIERINTDNIVAFLKENSRYSPYHLGNLRNSLASYGKFLKIYNEIEWDLIARVIPKTQPKLFLTVNHSDLTKLKSANNLKHKKNNERDNLILDFFLNTGLKIVYILVKCGGWFISEMRERD